MTSLYIITALPCIAAYTFLVYMVGDANGFCRGYAKCETDTDNVLLRRLPGQVIQFSEALARKMQG